MFAFRRPAAPPPEPVPAGGVPLPDGAAPPPVAPPLSRRRKWLRRLSRGFAIFAVLFILLVGWLAITAPLSKSLEPIAPPQITLLASDGTPIARTGAIVDAPVKAKDLPRHVTGAFLAIEDRRFYSHWGVDPRSVARAVWSNVTGGTTQGGSTITQQLAKFTFLTPKKTLGRKAREALIAFWLEAWLSKDEILERYLSNAYFGDNTYGLRAASLHYFYRQPEKLTPGQAAMLAGLVQAPSRLAPTKNPDMAEARMRLVLGAMADTGYMTETEAKAVRTPRIDVRTRNTLPTGTYFADWALPEARKLSDVGYSRQTITTTLDSRLQAAARRAVNRAGLGKAQVALVAMRPNGEVVAMVGGRDYGASPFNRVTQARRQPGSTFKLFVYLAALRDGWDPDDTIANTPIETGSYRPKNAGGSYSETISLEDAFATSSNVAAVRLFNEVGSDKVIKMARDLGVTSPLAEGDPSLALGTSSMTLLELTAAYAGVAANSYPVVPHAFKAEEKGWFESLFSGPDRFGSDDHEAIEQMLRAAVNRGTGRAARLPIANFGKTGTSQDSRDALFIGYAGGLVVGVWIGNDDNSPLVGIAGGGLPARIWRDFMADAHGAKRPPAPRSNPRGPVQPLDVPDVQAIPVGETTTVGVRDGSAVVTTEINGTRIDLRLPIDGGTPAIGPPPEPPPKPSPRQ
ncbi:transglycosylase domain-containing protein [Sphingopyxis sp. PET50]|uniref:transglycosylase domain-containing protein n=1 Tax=Sphingopyxis sp. PET50 TaxID=2976533 RepID=UPI0021AF5D0B|nr:transglycosylase domain-containing protein [Sphingopyxis sp. PET50]